MRAVKRRIIRGEKRSGRDVESRRRFNIASSNALGEILRGGTKSPSSVLDVVPGGNKFVRKILSNAPITKAEEKKAIKAIEEVVDVSQRFDVMEEIMKAAREKKVPSDVALKKLAMIASLSGNEVIAYTLKNPDVMNSKAEEMLVEKKGWIAWMKQIGASVYNSLSGWISSIWSLIKRCASSWACIASVALIALFLYAAWVYGLGATASSWFQTGMTSVATKLKPFLENLYTMITSFLIMVTGKINENIWVPITEYAGIGLEWVKAWGGFNTGAITAAGRATNQAIDVAEKSAYMAGSGACAIYVGGTAAAAFPPIAPFAFIGSFIGCSMITKPVTSGIGHAWKSKTVAQELRFFDTKLPVVGLSLFDIWGWIVQRGLMSVFATFATTGIGSVIVSKTKNFLTKHKVVSEEQLTTEAINETVAMVARSGREARKLYADTIFDLSLDMTREGFAFATSANYTAYLAKKLSKTTNKKKRQKLELKYKVASDITKIREKEVEDMTEDEKLFIGRVVTGKEVELSGEKLNLAAEKALSELNKSIDDEEDSDECVHDPNRRGKNHPPYDPDKCKGMVKQGKDGKLYRSEPVRSGKNKGKKYRWYRTK